MSSKVYRLKNFIMNRTKKQYNHLAHEFEINLTKDTLIYQIHCDTYINIDVSFNFTKISAISLADIGKCFGYQCLYSYVFFSNIISF